MCHWFKKMMGKKCNCEKCCKPEGSVPGAAGNTMNMGEKPAAGQKDNPEKTQ